LHNEQIFAEGRIDLQAVVSFDCEVRPFRLIARLGITKCITYLQSQGTKDVEFEDQQAINKFNKLFTLSGEIEAELKAKKVTSFYTVHSRRVAADHASLRLLQLLP